MTCTNTHSQPAAHIDYGICCGACGAWTGAKYTRDDVFDRPTIASPMSKALEAVLLFYEAGAWTMDKRSRWQALTGVDEATTKALCDTVRAALRSATSGAPASGAARDPEGPGDGA